MGAVLTADPRVNTPATFLVQIQRNILLPTLWVGRKKGLSGKSQIRPNTSQQQLNHMGEKGTNPTGRAPSWVLMPLKKNFKKCKKVLDRVFLECNIYFIKYKELRRSLCPIKYKVEFIPKSPLYISLEIQQHKD